MKMFPSYAVLAGSVGGLNCSLTAIVVMQVNGHGLKGVGLAPGDAMQVSQDKMGLKLRKL